jgi:hypothetical protein
MKAQGLAAFMVALGCLFVAAGSASAATAPTANLLANPGAEAGPGSADGVVIDVPPSWTTTAGFTAIQYGAPGGFPTTAQSATIGGGRNFFGGGNTALATATQTVDVFSATSQIDAGQAQATLSGYLGGFSSQDDNMTVTATYLNAHSNGTSLGSLRIGPVTASDRGGQTELLRRVASGRVPRGTRAVQVVMTATRLAGTSNDGYADNISLTLSSAGPVPRPVLGRAVNVAPVSGTVLVKLRGQGFVPLSAGQQIPVGALLDTTRGTVRLSSAANARGAVQTGDFTGGLFQVGQSRSGGGLTDLNLSGGNFGGCATGAGTRAVAARSSRVVRRLRGRAKGRFRTRGRYSAATVRGTNWTVEDRCDGTLTRVRTGVVAVNDFRRHRNVTVRAGHTYLARAP